MCVRSPVTCAVSRGAIAPRYENYEQTLLRPPCLPAGALSVDHSSISIDGVTTFANNSASFGGEVAQNTVMSCAVISIINHIGTFDTSI